MTCTARRCNTILLEGYKIEKVIIITSAKVPWRKGTILEIQIKIYNIKFLVTCPIF